MFQALKSSCFPPPAPPEGRGVRGALAVLLFLLFYPFAGQAAIFNAQSTTLHNGLQIIVVEDHRAPIVQHTLWIKAGAADDPYRKSGLAHYLEHLMFKGTVKFPQGEYSKRIARVGGSENAFTTADYTAFEALVAKQNLPLVMEMEADRLANLQIDEAKAKPELAVILDERRQRVDNDPYAPFSQGMAAALFPHHPYGTPVIGWKEEMETFTFQDALGFYHQWYQPANAMVVVSGDVNPKEVIALAEKYYGVIPASAPITRARVKAPVFGSDIKITAQSAQIQQRMLQYELRAPSHRTDAPMSYALEVLQEILAGSPASYLPKTLVQEKKIASHLEVNYEPDSYDESTFSVSIVPQQGQTDEAILAGLKKALKGASKALTPDEITRAKQSLQRSAIFARDSVSSPAYIIGAAMATGRTLPEIEAWSERIAAVTPEQLQKALDLIVNAPAVSGSITPTPGAAKDGTEPVTFHPEGPMQ